MGKKYDLEHAQLILLKDINEAVKEGEHLEAVLEKAVKGVARIFDYVVCDIFLMDHGNLKLTALSVDPSIKEEVERLTGVNVEGFKFHLFEGSRFEEVLKARAPIILGNVADEFKGFIDDDRLRELVPRVIDAVGFNCVLGVPLLSKERVFGVLGAATRRDISSDDLNAIQLFSSHLAVVIDRKLTEEALRESEERFRMLTENSLAGVYIIQDNKFRYVNPALAQFFGFTPDELIDKLGPLELTHPEDHSMVTERMRRRLTGEVDSVRYTFRGLQKNGTTKYFEVLGRGHEYDGKSAVIGTIIDITEQKRAEEEMKRRLMKFRLSDGNLYLVKESLPSMSMEAFKDLLKVGYRGLAVSRSPEEEIRKTMDEEFESLWLSDKGDFSPGNSVLSCIEKTIEDLPRKSAVLIDRIDYLVFKCGFKKTLSLVQRLRDLAYLGGHVLILSVDPVTFNKRELRLLDKEAKEIETAHPDGLSEELLDLLKYVYRQNALGVKPSHTDVCKNLGISKPTAQKRINLLNSAGLIMEFTHGRRKNVEVMERGRSLLLK